MADYGDFLGNYNEIPYDAATPQMASCSEFGTELWQGGEF